MGVRLEFGSKWFYISGVTITILLWLVLYFVNILVGILLAPFLIIGGAYLAIVKAKVENEKWYLIGNALFAYGVSAASVNVLLFLALFGPQIWNMLFEANGYIAAIGGLLVFSGALGVVSIAVCSFLGTFAVFIRNHLKKK